MTASTEPVSEREVLPTNVKPRHYVVELTPFIEKFTFDGSVTVHLDVKEDTSTIVCNANEITIKSAKVVSAGSVYEAKKIELNEKLEQATVHFDTTLKAGTAVEFGAVFSGILNDKMAGFYRSGYTDKGGVKKYMAVTQFEATDARRAFPCWDEPALKATFEIILNVPKDRTALSNMDVKAEDSIEVLGETWKRVSFSKTPIMSTYLVAFVVGELDYVETTASPKAPSSAQPITVRVYTLPGDQNQGKFALNVAARTLEFFSEYFDIPYPLPKSDLVAIPDFSAGAMENWGLVTYRTIYLLFDETSSAAKSKERVAYVVGHELAHQWFGNLVTMEWWEHLWLNEGFATYVGWLAVDHLHPEWEVWTQFVTDDLQRGLTLDAMKSSHPIEVQVRSPAEITQIFDAISYSKGASVIRMLATHLGQEVFVNGVRTYLKEFSYANASTNDLWRHLSKSSGQDIRSLMHVWTREMGYPVLNVKHEKHGDSVSLCLKQRRFLSNGNVSDEDDKIVYWVPVSVKGKDVTNVVVNKREQTVNVPVSADNFYKLNLDVTGFYRVNYPKEQLKLLGQLANEKLSMSDRVGLVTDAFALAISGDGSTVNALELVKALKNEEQYIVLGEIASRLLTLKSYFYKQADIQNGISLLGRELYLPVVEKLGYDYEAGEDHLTTQKRTLAISVAGKSGASSVVNEVQRRFEKFVKGDESALNPNLRGVAYSLVLRNVPEGQAAEAAYNAVLKIFKEAPTVDQQLAALASLGSCPHEAQIERTLELALDANVVRPQDIIYPLGTLSRDNPNADFVRQRIWKWFVANWDALYERYHSSLSLLGRCLSASREEAIGETYAQELENWVSGKGETDEVKRKRKEETKGITRNITQVLEKMRCNSAWVHRDHEDVAKWFKELKF